MTLENLNSGSVLIAIAESSFFHCGYLLLCLKAKASMQFEMKTLQQNLEKVTSAHKSTSAQLDAKNRKYASIEGAKSEQVKSKRACSMCVFKFCVTTFFFQEGVRFPIVAV